MKSSRVLRLYVRPDWPGHEAACSWAVRGPDQRVLERGRGTATQWPEADEIEAVVTAQQVSWLSINLPEKMGRDASRIVAYALEDKLIQPPETMHIVVSEQTQSAIAVAKARLKEITDGFRIAGRRVDRLFVEMQLADCRNDEWIVCRYGESAFLRMGTQSALAIDLPGTSPPDALALAIARARGRMPARVVVKLPAADSPSLEGWTAALGVPVISEAPFDPLAASAAGAANLLTGSFAPSGTSGSTEHSLRRAAAGLFVLAVVHTLLSLADWAWLAYRASALREQGIAIYRQTFPENKGPVLDPSLQFHRDADAAMRLRGKAGRGDMLTMLALISGELPAGARLRRVQFDRSVLEVVAAMPESEVSRMVSAMQLRGYGIDTFVLKRDASGTEYRMRLSLK